jgi:hypothetical protein
MSASHCSRRRFGAIDRPRLKSHFFGGRSGEKRAMAMDSDEIEFRAVPAICLAPSYRWEPGLGAETYLACGIQLHFTIALPGGVSGKNCRSTKIKKAVQKFTTRAFIAHFESGKRMAVLTPFLQARC